MYWAEPAILFLITIIAITPNNLIFQVWKFCSQIKRTLVVAPGAFCKTQVILRIPFLSALPISDFTVHAVAAFQAFLISSRTISGCTNSNDKNWAFNLMQTSSSRSRKNSFLYYMLFLTRFNLVYAAWLFSPLLLVWSEDSRECQEQGRSERSRGR